MEKGSGDEEASQRNAAEVGCEQQVDTKENEVAKYEGVHSELIEHFDGTCSVKAELCTFIPIWCTLYLF